MQRSMRQRGDAWELMVYLGCDVVSRRKRYSSKTVWGGKREAQRALRALVAQAEAGSLAKTKAAVGELLEEWFDQAKGDRETCGYIDRYLAPALGDVRLGGERMLDTHRHSDRLAGHDHGADARCIDRTADEHNVKGVALKEVGGVATRGQAFLSPTSPLSRDTGSGIESGPATVVRTSVRRP